MLENLNYKQYISEQEQDDSEKEDFINLENEEYNQENETI